jgi:transcriptional regulator with XRE-family HTH domain
MVSTRNEPLRRGDLVHYQNYNYVVAATNREGKLRLLGAQEGAPPAPRLLAPGRVKLISRAPRLREGGRAATDPARVKAVGAMLQQAREAMGYSTRRLADTIGVSGPYVSRAETDTHPYAPSAAYLERFAEVTGADELALCATAGVIPARIAEALTDLETLRAVDLLIAKLKGTP